MTISIYNVVYFSDLLPVKYVNLIFWLEKFVCFNDLHILKVIGVMRMKNKLNVCELYWEKFKLEHFI